MKLKTESGLGDILGLPSIGLSVAAGALLAGLPMSTAALYGLAALGAVHAFLTLVLLLLWPFLRHTGQ